MLAPVYIVFLPMDSGVCSKEYEYMSCISFFSTPKPCSYLKKLQKLYCCSRRSKAVAFIGHRTSRVSQIVPGGLLVIWWHETCGAMTIGRLNFQSGGVDTLLECSSGVS